MFVFVFLVSLALAIAQQFADGQYNNGQYVQSTQYGTIYSSGQGSQPSGTQYGSSTMNPNTQNLQYDQSSNTYNNQQSYPSSQNSVSGVQHDPNMAYSNQQNQAGYNQQAQQAQYSNNGQGQAYPYNQQSQPGYSTQMDQSQNFNNGQPQIYSNDQQQIYGQQYDAGNGQTQYGQPSPNQQYNNGQSQNALYGSVGSSSGNTQVQIADYSFSNGNCKFENGYVTENGQQRQATQQDMATVTQYKQSLSDYMKQINSNMGDWVSDIFKTFSFAQGENRNIPVPSLPTPPQVPCLCSPQNCDTSQQSQQNVAYDPSNQYNQQGNQQYQQTMAPYNNQYQSNQNQLQYQNGAQQAPQYNGRRK